MIPQVASQFLGSLSAKQPFWMRHCESHCLYLSAIFQIMKRPVGKHFQQKLWSMVLHHLLDLDVNIHAKDLDRRSDLGGDVGEIGDLFHCDLGDGSKGSPAPDQRTHQLATLLTVMDAMMEITLEELENGVTKENRDQIWKIMMTLFDALMITTHEAQFVHFLVFHLVQKNPLEWTTSFIRRCLIQVEDSWTAAPLRSAYASYVASFLSRVKCAPHELRLQGLETLMTTCEAYAKKESEKKRELKKWTQNRSVAEEKTPLLSPVAQHEVRRERQVPARMERTCYVAGFLHVYAILDVSAVLCDTMASPKGPHLWRRCLPFRSSTSLSQPSRRLTRCRLAEDNGSRKTESIALPSSGSTESH